MTTPRPAVTTPTSTETTNSLHFSTKPGTVQGTLSGRISGVILEPATLLLLGLGAALAGRFRSRRSR